METTIKNIKERIEKKIGYLLSDFELIEIYRQGEINLSNYEENAIIKLSEKLAIK